MSRRPTLANDTSSAGGSMCAQVYKTAQVIEILVDGVSKNGNLLLTDAAAEWHTDDECYTSSSRWRAGSR